MTKKEMNKRLKYLDLKDEIYFIHTNIKVYEKTNLYFNEKQILQYKKQLKKLIYQIEKYEGISNDIDIEIFTIFEIMKEYI